MMLDMYNTEVCGTKFNLVFKDRMVLVGGKSGVGKTLLFKMIKADAIVNKKNIICISAEDINTINISELIRKKKGFVFVIDNAKVLLSNKDRYYISFDKMNQYIIFTHSTYGFEPRYMSIANLIYSNGTVKLDYVNGGIKNDNYMFSQSE